MLATVLYFTEKKNYTSTKCKSVLDPLKYARLKPLKWNINKNCHKTSNNALYRVSRVCHMASTDDIGKSLCYIIANCLFLINLYKDLIVLVHIKVLILNETVIFFLLFSRWLIFTVLQLTHVCAP